METEHSQAGVETGILILFTGLANEQAGVTNRFVIGIDTGRRTDPLDLEEVEGLEDRRYDSVSYFRKSAKSFNSFCMAQETASCQFTRDFFIL